MKKASSSKRPAALRAGNELSAKDKALFAAVLKDRPKLTPGLNQNTPQAFEEWMRAMPSPAPRDISVRVTITLQDCEWMQLLAIMANQSWTLDEAVTDIMNAEVINDFLNALPGENGDLAKGAK